MRAFDVALFAQSDQTLEDLSTVFHSRFEGVISKIETSFRVRALVDGETGLAAARKIICELEEILPLRVTAVDPDLVDIPEIARRVKKSRQAVQQWVTNVGQEMDFPEPIGSPGGKRIWAWCQVDEWIRSARRELAREWAPVSLDDTVILSSWLIERRAMHRSEAQLSRQGTLVLRPASVVCDGKMQGTFTARMVA